MRPSGDRPPRNHQRDHVPRGTETREKTYYLRDPCLRGSSHYWSAPRRAEFEDLVLFAPRMAAAAAKTNDRR